MIGLRAHYAMPGTDIPYGPSDHTVHCSMQCPVLRHVPYAVSGTEMWYAATRYELLILYEHEVLLPASPSSDVLPMQCPVLK